MQHTVRIVFFFFFCKTKPQPRLPPRCCKALHTSSTLKYIFCTSTSVFTVTRVGYSRDGYGLYLFKDEAWIVNFPIGEPRLTLPQGRMDVLDAETGRSWHWILTRQALHICPP